MSSNIRIIGLAGTFASGKDTLADYLVAHKNFYHVSTGDIIREESMKLHGSTDRVYLREVANQMRSERGPGVTIEIGMERFSGLQEDYDGIVFSGIRSLGEAEKLQGLGGQLLFVDADKKLRYQRAFTRGRDQADVTFEDFQKSEALEMNKPMDNKTDQNIGGLQQLADIRLSNNGDLENFYSDAVQKLDLR